MIAIYGDYSSANDRRYRWTGEQGEDNSGIIEEVSSRFVDTPSLERLRSLVMLRSRGGEGLELRIGAGRRNCKRLECHDEQLADGNAIGWDCVASTEID